MYIDSMFRTIDFASYENSPSKYVLVDVRSPSEFMESTITGAVNVYLFSDSERAHVGTVYKTKGKSEAVRLGIDYVSRSLARIYDGLEKSVEKQKKLLIFCARGGMRSEAVGSFISSIGFSAVKLDKGYKGYRHHVAARLPELIESKRFVTLYGKTCTGKTFILDEIKKLGRGILDLEKAANHRGSVFGSVGIGRQNSQKQFETYIYDALLSAQDDIVYTEGESLRIGNVYMPNILYEKMQQGVKLLIEADMDIRLGVIQDAYLKDGFRKEDAKAALSTLERYIGKAKIAEYSALIDAGELASVSEKLMLKYYDIVYNTGHNIYEHTFFNNSHSATAADIVSYTESGRFTV